MKPKFKVGDIVRILPEYIEGDIREIIYVDETDDDLPYRLDGDNGFRLRWWAESMLEKYEPKLELTAEEVRVVRKALIQARWYIRDFISEFLHETEPEIIQQNILISNDYSNLLTRIKEWQDENKETLPGT